MPREEAVMIPQGWLNKVSIKKLIFTRQQQDMPFKSTIVNQK